MAEPGVLTTLHGQFATLLLMAAPPVRAVAWGDGGPIRRKTAARRARLASLVPPALPFASPQDVSRSREHREAVCVRVATDVVGVRMARRAPLAVHSVRTHARMNPGSPVESRYAARLVIAV
jgi:hypothetical protein